MTASVIAGCGCHLFRPNEVSADLNRTSCLRRTELRIDAPILSPELRVLRSSAPLRFKLPVVLFGIERDIIALAKKSLRVMDSLLQTLHTTNARCLSKTASTLMIFKWLNRKVSASRLMPELLRTHYCGTCQKTIAWRSRLPYSEMSVAGRSGRRSCDNNAVHLSGR